MGQPAIAAKLLSTARAQGGEDNLLEKMRKQTLAGALVLVGLFIFALSVISFGPRGAQTRAAEALPLAVDVTHTVKAAAPAASVLAPVAALPVPAASVDTAPVPIVKKNAKAVIPGRTHPAAKMARASSPAVSAATSAVIPDATPPVISPATLEIEVEHKFAEANLSVWVDDLLTYTHRLEGTDKKHLVVFHHVEGHEFHAMQVSPGKHSLRVQVTSVEAAYQRSATVAGEFASGRENVLRINFDKRGDMTLNLQ